MNIPLAAILAILVSFQLLFIAVFLLSHKKGDRLGNRLLGIFFLLLSINFFDIVLQLSGSGLAVSFPAFVDDGLMYLYGPLLYLYTLAHVSRPFSLRKKDLVHGIPAVFVIVILIIAYVRISDESRIQFAEHLRQFQLPAYIYLIGLIVYLHMIIYLWFSARALRQYRQLIREKYSTIDQLNLNWLDFLLKNVGFLLILSVLNAILPLSRISYGVELSMGLLLLYLFYFINRVIFKALNQPQLFSGVSVSERPKYAGSTLHEEERLKIIQALKVAMEDKKLFLNPDLTIDILAAHLKISARKLSQIINQSFEKSFFDYVNTYRIEEAKHLLTHPPDPKMTILEIMYAVGFNSKSSFNTMFKKMTGMTPSSFKKRE